MDILNEAKSIWVNLSKEPKCLYYNRTTDNLTFTNDSSCSIIGTYNYKVQLRELVEDIVFVVKGNH